MTDAAVVDPAPPFLGITRSITGRRWRLRTTDDRRALALAEQFGLPEIIGRVLAARGVDPADADGYLNPSLRALLPDPSKLADMDRAADRVARAITTGEAVAVFGDYDVDGATSAALLKRYFDAVGGQMTIYIPDRLTEGYGPNLPALLRLRAAGIGLTITVDCGIVAFAPLAGAADAGLEVVVVDHHLAESQLPRAYAVVNPNRADDSSGLGQLAAVGVAYLLVVATNRALRRLGWFADGRAEPNLLQWLDLVALGTVCDVVPLVGLNRALVARGLEVMARRRNIGLAALADVGRLDQPPGTYHAGFVLGPRVNAGGRVGKSDLGARLLTTADPAEAAALAAELDRLNGERREIERTVLAAAVAEAESTVAAGKLGPLLVAAGADWHPGVIGIVASRLVERFGRPAFVIALDGRLGKGSGRSIAGVDLGAAVTAARQAGLLVDGGGHAMAAGLTVERDRLAELVEFLERRLAKSVAAAAQAARLGFDGALSVGGATVDLFELLQSAGPYGAGNPEPRFAVAAARLVKTDVVGTGHVRCILAGAEGGRLKGIAFRAMESALGPALLQHRGGTLHLAGHLRADTWRGDRQVQFVIEDAAHPAG